MKKILVAAMALAALVATAPARAEVDEIKIPKGAGGVGFLGLLMMEKHGLVEKHAKALGLDTTKVSYVNLGGPAQVNDALLSGNAHVVPAGPPAFLTIWGRTRDSLKVTGLAAMTSMPMYLNTRSPEIRSIKDVGAKDKIAITAIKVSIPAIIMQMYAKKEFGADKATYFDPMTVGMTHPDALAALLAGEGNEINLHFTSPPFHQRERRDPKIRTILTTNDVMGSSQTFTMLYMTAEFRDKNPKSTKAILAGLEEANAMINADKKAAAEVFLDTVGRRGWTAEEIVDVLNDPDNKFTTTPENVMTYANFMADIGTLKVRPASWKDLFFPEIHDKPGT
jgi:NitT/TauT family transport system substrate-binding protein